MNDSSGTITATPPSDAETREPAPEAAAHGWRADVALLAVAVIWGLNIPVMKHAVGLMDRFAFNALRLTFSALVLGLLARREDRTRVEGWSRILLVAAIGGFAYQVTFVEGIRRTLAGNTALILATTPMWTAVIAWLLRTEELRKLAWFGLLITLCGTIVVTFDPESVGLSSDHLAGNLLVLAASCLWSLATVLSRPVLDDISPTRLAFYCAAFTLPAHYLVAWPSLGAALAVALQPVPLTCVVLSGVFSTGIAYALWNYGVRHVGPSHSAVYQNVVPVIALAGGWMFLNEAVIPAQIAGGVLILGGLLIMRRGR